MPPTITQKTSKSYALPTNKLRSQLATIPFTSGVVIEEIGIKHLGVVRLVDLGIKAQSFPRNQYSNPLNTGQICNLGFGWCYSKISFFGEIFTTLILCSDININDRITIIKQLITSVVTVAMTIQDLQLRCGLHQTADPANPIHVVVSLEHDGNRLRCSKSFRVPECALTVGVLQIHRTNLIRLENLFQALESPRAWTS